MPLDVSRGLEAIRHSVLYASGKKQCRNNCRPMPRQKISREEKQQRARERYKRWLASMSPEKREEHRAKRRDYMRRWKAGMTPARRREYLTRRNRSHPPWKTSRRRYTKTEDAKLKEIYQRWPQAAIKKEFPRRTWVSLRNRANLLGLKRACRPWSNIERKNRSNELVIRALEDRRREMGVTIRALSKKIGVTCDYVGAWERGKATPSFFNLICWCKALGVELTLTPLQK